MVSEKMAYEWVKNGHWTFEEFNAWITAKLLEKYSVGFDDGFQEGGHEEFLTERG